MTETLESKATAKRPRSWRDKVFAEYEISQARLRYELDAEAETPEEFI